MSTELTILGAAYGRGCVTDKVRSLVSNNQLRVTASNDMFGGDTWPGVLKSLVVVCQYGDNSPRVYVVKEHDVLKITYENYGKALAASEVTGASILGAVYGLVEVTSTVSKLVKDNKLEITVTPKTLSSGADPWPNNPKTFVAVFRGSDKPYMIIATDDEYISVSDQ